MSRDKNTLQSEGFEKLENADNSVTVQESAVSNVASIINRLRRGMAGKAASGALLALGVLTEGCTLDTMGECEGLCGASIEAGTDDVKNDNLVLPEAGGSAGEDGGTESQGGFGGSETGGTGGAAGTGGTAGTGGIAGSGGIGGSSGLGGSAGEDAGGSAGTGGEDAGDSGPDVIDAGPDVPEGSVCQANEHSIKYSDEMGCYKVLYVRSGSIMPAPLSSNDDHSCQSNPLSSNDVKPNDVSLVWVRDLTGDAGASLDISKLKFDTCNVNPVTVDGTCDYTYCDGSSAPNWTELANIYNNSGSFINLVPIQTSPWVYNVTQSCPCKAYRIHL